MSKNKKKSEEILDQAQNDQNVESTEEETTQANDQSQEQNAQDSQVEEASSTASSTPAPGNPYTVSADGRGRPYDPAIDGAPGKEAEEKQAKADHPQ